MERTKDVQVVRLGLLVLGLYQLALGLWIAVAPRSFFDVLGDFGARNVHYLRDDASWELALAVAALLAVGRPRWRVPVIALALVHFSLHALNHLVDVSDADPGWVGPFDLAALAAGAVGLGWLLARALAADAASR